MGSDLCNVLYYPWKRWKVHCLNQEYTPFLENYESAEEIFFHGSFVEKWSAFLKRGQDLLDIVKILS